MTRTFTPGQQIRTTDLPAKLRIASDYGAWVLAFLEVPEKHTPTPFIAHKSRIIDDSPKAVPGRTYWDSDRYGYVFGTEYGRVACNDGLAQMIITDFNPDIHTEKK